MKSFYFSKFNFLKESIDKQHKIALIPGSFKPPHKGHYEMIKYYSNLVGPNGDVIVFVSKPSKKNERKTALGTVVSAEVTKEILELYCKKLPNVKIEISPISPVKSAYDYGENAKGGVLIYGCSKKDDDIKRFQKVKEYVETKNPNVIVMDPITTAMEPVVNVDSFYSASNFRDSFGDEEKMKEFIPDHLNDGQKEYVINLLLN